MLTAVQPAVRFDQVAYALNDVQILKPISGFFPDGQITVIVGPSGAGKTTLLKLCNGLLSPASGEIHIHRKLITEYEPVQLRRHVGIALQQAPMISGSVMDNLSLPLRLQGKKLSKESAAHLLDEVGLPEAFMNRSTKDLSGGERQKVSIARTLVNRPQILLLDEITSSLDQVSRQDIESLIRRLNQKHGTTIIWITHQLEQALTVGSWFWFMMEGEVIDLGEIDKLHTPTDARVRRFVKGDQA